MTRSEALEMVNACVRQGRIKWLGKERPDQQDLMVLLSYWPQILARRRELDVKQARTFFASLGFEVIAVPEECGTGDLGVTHPEGDEYGAKLALDILEGRREVDSVLKEVEKERERAAREAAAFEHGRVHRGDGRVVVTHQNRRYR